MTTWFFVQFTMFFEVTVLILFYFHGANCHGEELCGSSLEMRRATIHKRLADIDCKDYICGKENLINYDQLVGRTEIPK